MDAGEQQTPRWLTDDELAAFLAYLRGSTMLNEALDRDLQAHGVSLSEYECLALLSQSHGHSMRMAALAADVIVSRSRLTHTANRLERQGWVVRRPAVEDRRGIDLCLTEAGRQRVDELSPVHLASVRRHIVDVLDRDDLLTLGRIMVSVRTALQSPACDETAR